MKITKIVCDRCKQEIPADPVKIVMEVIDKASEDLKESLNPDIEGLDFCNSCASFITNWLKWQCSLPAEELLMPEEALHTQKKNLRERKV